MARNSNKAAQDIPADSGFSFANITVTDSENVPARAPRDEKPNPLLGAVSASLADGKWKRLPAIPAEAAKEADNYLRRAAIKLSCAMKIRKETQDDGTVVVHFIGSNERRARNYTVEDVRAWAVEIGYDASDLHPKVHRDISNAYREAHGLKVNKSK